MDLFDAAFALVVGEEGGYVFDPRDRGGETKFGISRRAYPWIDIASLSLQGARDIYQRDYWQKHHCGEMPWPWALAVFDCAVNQGGAVELAQAALGLGVDGAAGRETFMAMARAQDDAFHAYLALRAERYARAPEFGEFGRGWMKRLFRVAQAAEHPPR
ncbi:MAG TPA: glycosyl hydrolase 108 family protein [Stellaceae bacterium]|nr:glycosyl hydrolase 108 family protein [Stellaceae bacterium]